MRRETPSPSNGYNVCMNVYILSCYIYSVKYFYIFIFLDKIMGPCDILVRALFATRHKRLRRATPSEGYVGLSFFVQRSDDFRRRFYFFRPPFCISEPSISGIGRSANDDIMADMDLPDLNTYYHTVFILSSVFVFLLTMNN